MLKKIIDYWVMDIAKINPAVEFYLFYSFISHAVLYHMHALFLCID